jgi:hypothetical protein
LTTEQLEEKKKRKLKWLKEKKSREKRDCVAQILMVYGIMDSGKNEGLGMSS